MAVLLLVGLYTSRVVLSSLGESDYGIYNVVGGVVAMFTVISGALSSAISRFITFELGRGGQRLRAVFRCSVLVQSVLAAAVVVLCETAGMWFIAEKMTIPPERIPAAGWVLQFSLLAFVINLLSVPYNAVIIAHEKMGAFAAVGLFEGFAKLGVALLLAAAPFDRLVWYSMLMCAVAVLVRLAYTVYCRRRFDECRRTSGARTRAEDRKILKEIFSFAGWNFIGVTAGVLKDQGGNILINLFSSTPAVNAGRGVAMQLSGAVQGFVTNFMTAVNPQITKSYAAGQLDGMHALMRKSAKFSYFLILVFALPLLLATDWLLGLWLAEVPESAARFVRLAIVLVLSDSLSNPLITAQLATGNIRRYQLVVGGILLLNIPVSWALLAAGLGVEYVFVVAIALSQVSMFARLALLKGMVGLDVRRWMKEVWLTAVAVTLYAGLPLLPLLRILHPLPLAALSLCTTAAAVWFRGCTGSERAAFRDAVRRKICGNDELSVFAELPRKVYAATNSSREILLGSSSGGVFYPLAREVVSEGGAVCAAVWDGDFRGVHHDFAEDVAGLRKMCGSRYVQSSLGGCFLKIRDLLEEGRPVMFVGTPCQVLSLKRYMQSVAAGTGDSGSSACGKGTFSISREQSQACLSYAETRKVAYEIRRLLLVEILCHGTPERRAWREYLDSLVSESGADGVSSVNFRDKSSGGWKDYNVTTVLRMPDGSERVLSAPYMQVPYMKDFIENRNLCRRCLSCSSRNGRSGADISLGDFWGVEKLLPEAYDAAGVSVVGIYSDYGEQMLDRISGSLVLTGIPMPVFARSISRNGGYGRPADTVRPCRGIVKLPGKLKENLKKTGKI